MSNRMNALVIRGTTLLRRCFAVVVVSLQANLSGCVLGGTTEYYEIHAPSSFRPGGEPFEIGEWDPWGITRVRGCIQPGETVRVRARRVGSSLMVSIPKSTVTVSNNPDRPPVSLFAAVSVQGDGTETSPFVIRFAELARWFAFVDAWEAHRTTPHAIPQDHFEFEGDAIELRNVKSAPDLNVLFSNSDGVREKYYAWLDEFNVDDKFEKVCADANKKMP